MAEDIHNHPWSYCARILVGDLVHETWRYEAGEGNAAECLATGGPRQPCRPVSSGSLTLSGRYSMAAGSSYFFPASGFHGVLARRAVALLCRGEAEARQALVVRGAGPDAAPCAACAGHRSADECWDIIADLLGR